MCFSEKRIVKAYELAKARYTDLRVDTDYDKKLHL